MSKSLRNYPDPNKILDEYGADATRFVSFPLRGAVEADVGHIECFS
jgi:isoleucyl-tRNA synthetase